MPHTSPAPGSPGRRRRPGARLAAFAAICVALALQVVPQGPAAQASTPAAIPAGFVAADAPVSGVDLQASMTGPTAVSPGRNVTDSIVITNGGDQDANGVSFDLTDLPTGEDITVDGTGVICNASWHCTVDGGLPHGAQLPVTLIMSTSTLDAGDEVDPSVTVATTDTDVDPSNDVADFTTAIAFTGQLSVTAVRTSSANLLPGNRATFTITVTNHGTQPSQGVAVAAAALIAPSSSDHNASASSGGSCHAEGTDGTRVCEWSSIPAGQSRVMRYAATGSVHLLSGFFRMNVAAASDDSDLVTTSAQATITDTNTRAVNLSVETYMTPKVKPGHKGRWRLTISNHGPYRAHDVVLTTTLPDGFQWAPVNGRALRGSSSSKSSRLGDIEAGTTYASSGYFRYPSGTTLVWNLHISHSDPESKPSDNTSVSRSQVGSGTVVKSSTTQHSSGTVVNTADTSSSSNDSVVSGITDDSGNSTTSTDSTDGTGKELADTGGPALRLPLLGFTLMLLGAVSSLSTRRLRPAPRHRAWVSPYA